MTPADQRLRTYQFVSAEVNLGLVEQFEFAALGRLRDLALECEAHLDCLPHALFEGCISSPVRSFSVRKRDMPVANQLIWRAPVRGKRRGAYGQFHIVRSTCSNYGLLEGVAKPCFDLSDAGASAGAGES